MEVVPNEPANHRLGQFTQRKDVLPGDQDVGEPHLAVEFVIAMSGATNGFALRAAALPQTVVTPGALTGTMNVARCPSMSMPQIVVLGIGRARMHADLAADDDAAVGLTDEL